MTPHEFITKWRAVELKERSASQSHFNDLCVVLGHPTPIEADPKGEWFTFEKGALKTGGGGGWADVWKRSCFAWEYKGKRKNLDDAYVQLQRYAVALENPPLLIVSDMERFRIHTNWTNTVQQVYELTLEELADERRLRILRQAFSDTEDEQLKPGKTRQELSEDVAAKFARIAKNLRDRDHEPHLVAHFVNRMLFCMFAEDVGLLPNHMFRRMLEASKAAPGSFVENARKLFAAMRKGGSVGFERVEWFNGGIFDDDTVLPLTVKEIKEALDAARLDWSNIDPSVMGTLFERGLDPDKRSQLGAHYTDRDKIMLIVNPVIVEPLTREWEETKTQIGSLMDRSRTHRDQAQRTRAYNEAVSLHQRYIERLKGFRVLDPACGSGNFLYLSLHTLKDMEHLANLEAEQLGLPFIFPSVGPECALGIEINSYAAELARVSIWIGEIQWMLRHGFAVSKHPILMPLNNIDCRDALLNEDGTEAEWPQTDVIVGNPPFLGDRKQRRVLGDSYVSLLRSVYDGRVAGKADLVAYWFQKAVEKLLNNQLNSFGLVGTKSVAKGASRTPLDRIESSRNHTIYNAWTNEPWIVEGANVRVALVVAGGALNQKLLLNGSEVGNINPDLTSGLDVTSVAELAENKGIAFQGVKLSGPFDITGDQAREFLQTSGNPNGKPNSDVVRRFWDVDDVVGRPSDRWVIEFGVSLSETDSAQYARPFELLRRNWSEETQRRKESEEDELRASEPKSKAAWWRFQRPRPKLRKALSTVERYIVTPESSEHRIFVWGEVDALIQGSLFAIARSDDATFGLLHSRVHEIWSTAHGNRLGVGNQRRYNVTRTLVTFPFPDGLTPNISAADYADLPLAQAIAATAKRLNELRENWLNPPELVKRQPEVVPGYPDRIFPVSENAAKELKKRTLTNLYNEWPTWLANVHRDLDRAVAATYGWPDDLSDVEILKRLFELNQERAEAGR